MKTLDYFLAVAYVVINVFSLVQLIGSYRWPTLTRVVFFLIFGIAAYVNTQTALNTSWVYESYADYAIPMLPNNYPAGHSTRPLSPPPMPTARPQPALV